jgi:endonuclease/exonuclease/phosphatase family metal-dependent hydrolase
MVGRMRAMTWNLWWRFGEDWRQREQAIMATLREVQPDIVGLQEVWAAAGATQAEVLADRLGLHSAYAAPSLPPPPRPPESPDQDGVELGVGLLSRWPVLQVQQHRLPSQRRNEPVALLATVDHPRGPLHAVVSCVEWELERGSQRLAQTRALATLLADDALDGPLPVLLLADLNAPPDTPEVRALSDVALDAWVTSGRGADEGQTFSTTNPLADPTAWQIDQRIDYVLVRAGTRGQPPGVEAAFLAGTPVDGLFPSDHDAVVADLHL